MIKRMLQKKGLSIGIIMGLVAVVVLLVIMIIFISNQSGKGDEGVSFIGNIFQSLKR